MGMEELFGDNKLGELEEKIDVLLRTYRGCERRKKALRAGSSPSKQRTGSLRNRWRRPTSEKDLVMQKVKGILEKIQKIEA